MNIHSALQELAALQSRLSAYRHAIESISYDGMTAAPKNTAENRAHTVDYLERKYKKIYGIGESLV